MLYTAFRSEEGNAFEINEWFRGEKVTLQIIELDSFRRILLANRSKSNETAFFLSKNSYKIPPI